MSDLSIGELAARTGVSEGTLRMWERRHGFPAPRRLPSGHRRYSETDVELVRRLAGERAAGMSLAGAIARVTSENHHGGGSVWADVRARRPDLEPRPLRKPVLLALSRAIEDESLARAERALLFASFQTERFYRQAEPRWRELSESAELAIVFADFERVRAPSDGPLEVPVGPGHPLAREWTIVCCAPGHSVCLAAWERPPAPGGRRGRARVLEAIWSVEPAVAHTAARVCAEIAGAAAPELPQRVADRLGRPPAPLVPEQLRLAAAITNRTLSYLGPEALDGPRSSRTRAETQ
ncbi:MAG TPA: DICT sensory domain-containing protein [Solirubrobacteraceae bacterium]|nr:DICT sensory domain-containing protein [Solirubrobacteraceae bacterium]